MQSTLKIYQKRLTNLSAKNRSLVLLRLLQGQFMDLHELDFVLHEPSFRIIDRLIARRIKTKICSTIDSRGKSANLASRQLRKIARTDKFIEEERGAKDLYVGFPFVQGKMLDDTLVRAPLLFFPVELRIEDNHWMLYAREDVPIAFNKTLLLAFSHYNTIQFDDDFLNQNFEEFSKNHTEFLTELYRYLEESPLEINFNQAIFEEKLQSFENFTKTDFESNTRTGELKAYPEAVLGLFPQAGSYLMPDYDTLLAAEQTQDVEAFFHPLAQLKDDPDIHQLVLAKAAEEESLTTPYQMDAAQEKAIKQVKTGDSMVVQGPPGSGKSQLICNLVADFIARKKNVLVVCQKKAALDVVYQRLDEKGFADFIALVHDFRNDRKEIYQRIHRNIEAIPDFISANNSLDAIYLERNFLKNSREIDQLTEELEEFKMALFDTKECGISVKELYLTTNKEEAAIKLRQEYKYFPSAESAEFNKKLRAYAAYAQKLKRPNHPWAERVSFKDFDLSDIPQIKEAVAEVKPYRDEVAAYVRELIAMDVSLDECLWILDREEQFRMLLILLEDETALRYFKNTLKYTKVEKIWLENRKQNVLSAFGEQGVEKTLDQKQLNNAVKALDQAIEAQKKWTERTKWKLFSKEKTFIHDLIINNQMEGYDDALFVLMEMVNNRMNLEHHLAALADTEWLIEKPEDYSKESYEKWFSHHIQAVEARDIYIALRNGIKYLAIEELTFEEIKEQILTLLTVVKNVPYQKKRWLQYLSNKQIKDLEEGKLQAERMIEVLDEDFDSLCEFDELVLRIDTHEMDIINRLYDAIGTWDADQLISCFENSLKIAWINHIEAKYPILKSVSTPKLQLLEDQLQEAMEAKKEVCEQIVLMNARERVYKEVEYNRLNNRVTYRDLQHQVNKKRSIWPLRKLIDNFSHELLDLIPCWMASPESVSAIFPMEKHFDLVIFDEASQCFAEKGIPAMYRGKQVVIVGDSQQLAPYDLYHPRWEEGIEDPALEVDSLLDLGCRYLP
ncbi:MAG: AAA domain-containing protein, partial [Flammeovirgaceae bacterium]